MTVQLDDYRDKYANATAAREDGILQVTFHSDGGPLALCESFHREMPYLFDDIANDFENRVVILTGTGDAWCDSTDRRGWGEASATPRGWDKMYHEGRRLYSNLLEIEVPVIAAVNGPATRHGCLPVVCDVVLAAEEATFQDSGHFLADAVPGDGHHVIWPYVLGPNRAKYFLLTGQTLTAQQLYEWGVVNEVLPRADLLRRAWEIARMFAQRSPLTLKYTGLVLNYELRHRLREAVEHGLAIEGLAYLDRGFEA